MSLEMEKFAIRLTKIDTLQESGHNCGLNVLWPLVNKSNNKLCLYVVTTYPKIPNIKADV